MFETTIESEFLAACQGFVGEIGFHGTTSLVCDKVENVGFLPDKVFDSADHATLLEVASLIGGVCTDGYKEWLDMRSVSFAKNAEDAISHVKQGKSGGQGLMNVEAVLRGIRNNGNAQQKVFAERFETRLQCIRNAPSVVYAVDLSGFGSRLVCDRHNPYYQYFFNPALALPTVSDIGPERLIARLNL